MGHGFSLPRLLNTADAATIDSLERIEAEILLNIIRLLIHDVSLCHDKESKLNLMPKGPAAVGHLLCCCKTLAQLARGDSYEARELRKARKAMARVFTFDLHILTRDPGRIPDGGWASTPRGLGTVEPFSQLHLESPERLNALRSETDELETLDLSRTNRTRSRCYGECVRRLLYASETIARVDLSVCYMASDDAVEIAKGLEVNRSLRSLNASGNFLSGYGQNGKFVRDEAGLSGFARALAVNTTLTSLNLSENRLGLQGIQALLPGVAATTSLLDLDLSRNNITGEGAEKLAEVLSANVSLTKLDLRLNQIGMLGAIALAPAVASGCHSLCGLDLRFNNISSNNGNDLEGETALRDAIRERHNRDAFVLRLHFEDDQQFFDSQQQQHQQPQASAFMSASPSELVVS